MVNYVISDCVVLRNESVTTLGEDLRPATNNGKHSAVINPNNLNNHNT